MSNATDPLSHLQVHQRLEVGPVRLDCDRLQMPYTVVSRNGTSETTQLTYSYKEPVFKPDEAVSQNLASLIGVQVALNYGLFFDEIVFRGSFDRHDRLFLEDMARNTSREIYVNKLLLPNPFLVENARDVAVVRRNDYLLARIRFEDEETGNLEPWMTSTERHCVLSSGGKDSLLTQGLLTEMGKETHPVFLNESGRHWYTALNAFRYFNENVPHTTRVWTNADRLYTWMLRRLPFIRKDFARLRSDEYPIRLWTVAVFLFGALPILRKRGVGRLLIGDEYDTTVRPSFSGIPHYSGLYDQSRYFDNALSRFFSRKGYGIAQFSLLRPLSEILIEKILVERYPELQRYQLSCHAAHIDGDRVRPCGRCEKCRRIVGMLVALKADPTLCGYNTKQITEALQAVGHLGVHQERAGAEHLIALLVEQGKLDTVGAKQHPAVMKLRFSREASPLDTIPNDLRKALYPLLLEHSDGAVRRSGRLWVEFDPLCDESLAATYRFEKKKQKIENGFSGQSNLWAEHSWPEAEKRLVPIDLVQFVEDIKGCRSTRSTRLAEDATQGALLKAGIPSKDL